MKGSLCDNYSKLGRVVWLKNWMKCVVVLWWKNEAKKTCGNPHTKNKNEAEYPFRNNLETMQDIFVTFT